LPARPLVDDDPTLPAPPPFTPVERPATPPSHAGRAFAPGQLVADRYRIQRFIAAGGMGEVYEVDDEALHDRVALKTIHATLASDTTTLERFRREISLARKVTHPNVCRVFDVGFHKMRSVDDPDEIVELTFLTMELLGGTTLAQHLNQAGALSTTEAHPLAAQMAAALDAAHAAGVIHRDFKSANVILVEKPERRAVVSDFGLSRAVEGARSLTGSGLVVGTPDYMAPEQLGGGAITTAVDVYAFGVVLYRMVTGRMPFLTVNPFEARRERVVPPPSPRAFVPSLPARWDTAILRCLAANPAERFATAGEAVRACGPMRRRWLRR
jgi:serine/threonine protein kinase